MCHISRENSGTTSGGMKTISFKQVRSAPKTRPIVYKTYVILRTQLRHLAIEWQQSAMNLITPVSKKRARTYYSVWHRICNFTHLFNIIFSDLRLVGHRTSLAPTWITILLNVRLALASTFKFAKMSGALDPGFSVGASLSGENLFDILIGTEEQCFDPRLGHPVALLHGLYRNRTMYRIPWVSRIQSLIYIPHILTILN